MFRLRSTWILVLVLFLGFTALAGATGPNQEVGPAAPRAENVVVGSNITYQGRLLESGNPANGVYDFQFVLFDANAGGNQVAIASADNVPVTQGLFTAIIDLGTGAFKGENRWLEIRVRPDGGSDYTPLSPRQLITPAPYALSLRPGASIQGTTGTMLSLSGGSLGVNASGSLYGVYGATGGEEGRGVYGYATATTGTNFGVYGQSASDHGRGVYGYASSSTGNTFGVAGINDSTSGVGTYGRATATSGTTYGVFGRTHSPDGYGVYGTGPNFGVKGISTDPKASAGEGYGVYGESNRSVFGAGVYGLATGSGGPTYGVYGKSTTEKGGVGVYGLASGETDLNYGVYGETRSSKGYAGYFRGADGYAGYFVGNVWISGDLVAANKNFRIDHPLDPANRYLQHAAQEAPQVQNVYNGVVVLDAQGEAEVQLPDYFSVLNTGPFRYQLTAIGAAMPDLHVAQEIQDNRFRIAGGVPGMKVSWEVTGIRNDPYIRDHPLQVEMEKPEDQRGTYLYPQGYGQPEEKGLDSRTDPMRQAAPEAVRGQ